MSNIPDFSLSYVPVTQALPLGNTMPKAPEARQQDSTNPVSSGLMTAAASGALTKRGGNEWQDTKDQLNGLGGSLSGLGQFASGALQGKGLSGQVEGIGGNLNNSGHGATAYDMLSASDAAQDAGKSGGMAALGSLFGYKGFASGGSVAGSRLLQKYNGHKAYALIAHHWGEENTDKWLQNGQNHDHVPIHVQHAVDNDLVKDAYARGGGIEGYANAGAVKPMPLPYTPIDYNEPIGSSRGDPMPRLDSVADSYAALNLGNNFGQNNPLTHLAAFGDSSPSPSISNYGANDIPANFDPRNLPASPQGIDSSHASPDTMAALLNAQSASGPQSTIPDSPVVTAQNSSGIASDATPSQGIGGNAQDALKTQLAANAPVLDKWQAIAMAGASMMAGKNRSALTNIGEGVQQGLMDYAGQKKAVADYALKEAEAEKAAQQLAQQADWHREEMSIQQQNADTNKAYKDVVAKATQQKANTYQKMNDPAAMGTTDPDMQGLFGDDFITALADKKGDAYANKIKSMADTGNLPSASSRSPLVQQQLEDIYQYAPHSSTATKAAIQAWDKGKQGDQLRFLSNTYTHLDTLDSLGTALQNGDTKTINSMTNKFKDQFGVAAPNNFDAAKQIVGNELVKAVMNGSGALGDREAVDKAISSANSPAQLAGVVQTYKALLGGQMKGMYNQFKVGTNQDDDAFMAHLDTPAKKELGKLIGVDNSAVSVPQASQYKEGQTATGPNGKKAIFTNGKWVTQ